MRGFEQEEPRIQLIDVCGLQTHRHERGQMAVEMLLLTTLFVGLALFVSESLRSNQFMAQLVSRPWAQLAGLIQNGVWGSPESTMFQHPSQPGRISTPEGERL